MAKTHSCPRNISCPFGRLGGAFLCLLFSITAPAQYIIHIAGNDSCGHYGDGGPALLASLNNPWGICRDSAGNLYLGDGSAVGENDGRVRKINIITGIITTIAGGVHLPPADSADNVPATSVDFNYAGGICIDRIGNLLIADGSHRIRKINLATDTITTVAGNAGLGYAGDGGPATAAQLSQPVAVAVDTANNVYIGSETTIRKISAVTGIITTIAGVADTPGFRGDGGPASSALLYSATDLYIDRNNNVYFADFHNYRIRMIRAGSSIITTIAGIGATGSYSGEGGAATAAALRSPDHITKDNAGNLYIADYRNIRKIDSITGIITTYGGNGMIPLGVDSVGDGGPATAAMMAPDGLCFDACGNMYFTDGLCRIRAITPDTPALRVCDTATVIVNTTGVAPTGPQGGVGLRVWPNPAASSLTVDYPGTAGQYEIMDVLGRTALQGELQTGKQAIDISGLVPGTYIISTFNDGGSTGHTTFVKR